MRRYSAFTLVELLVVLGILSLLMALLIPAILTARSAAQDTVCQNNLSQLGFGVLQHVQAKRIFPPYRGESPDKSGKLVGWLPLLLPYIDREGNYRQLRDGDARYKEDFELVNCPSNPVEDLANTPFPTSYAVMAGMPDDIDLDGVANENPPDRRENTLFHDHRPGVTKVTTNWDDCEAGVSRTAVISENVDLGQWDEVEFEFQQGLVFLSPSDPQRRLPNQDFGTLDYGHARPSSFHNGSTTINTVMADGSIQTVLTDEDFDYDMFRALMTPIKD